MQIRQAFLASCFSLVAGIGFTTIAAAETVTFRFVQTNDLDRMDEDDGRGGFARLAAVLSAKRAEGNTFFVHSGDAISPSLLSGIDKGRHIIALLNRLKPDVMVPGNHEFDFGPEVFRERLAEATFDIVSSNIREADGRAPAKTVDQKIVSIGDVKIGFYGLTTEDTAVLATPGDISFLPTPETGRRKAEELRAAGADFVVAVVHTPLQVDMILARDGAADLILSGHDEHLLTYFDGKVAMTESYSQADTVVVTTITLEKTVEDGKTDISWHPTFEVIDTASVTPDAEIAGVVKGFDEQLDKELQVEIGTTETALDSRRASVRTGETAIGNLFADAMRAAVGADIAITNGGGIRGDRDYAAGTTLTRADVFTELPFGNTTVKLELTGEQVLAALENGFSQVREAGGRFPQVSGIEVEADLGKPPGERVASVKVGGQPLDPAKVYSVATNNYMAGGGDGYKAFAGGKPVIDASAAQLMASQVIDYITKAGRISPKIEGRIRLTQ